MTLENINNHTCKIADAIQRREEFYTIEVGAETKHIMLPTPQVCGTMTQQRTYAMDKANELITILNK